MSVPSESSFEQSYLSRWRFVFYVGSSGWDGLVFARAQVWQEDRMLCAFSLSRRARPSEAQARLREECIAWVESRALR